MSDSVKPGQNVTEADLHFILRAFVETAGSQGKAAAALGVSAPYLSDVLKGRRAIADAIAIGLGYRRKVVFVKSVTFSKEVTP